MTDQPDNSLRDKITSAIEKGEVAMRPRWHFVLRGISFAAGVLLCGLILVYLISFAVFVLRQSGAWFAPGFGLRGVAEFVRSLPWLVVAAALVFIVSLEALVRHYSFAYRKPLLYSVIGVVVLTLFIGVAVEQTGFHEDLREQARQFNLPVAGSLYRGYGMMRLEHMDAGEVLEEIEGGFRIRSPRGEEVEVIVGPETALPREQEIAPGDRVIIMGEREDGSIRAEAVRKMKERDLPMTPPGLIRRQMK